nr:hypothetical protein [uncultured Psychroserpens sp.]
MKTKILFYGLLAMIFTRSVSLTEFTNTQFANILTVNTSSSNYDELKPRRPCEGPCEEDPEIELEAEWIIYN